LLKLAREVAVPPFLLRTLLDWVEVFGPALTRPGFANALVVLVGWVRTSGVHAVTEALVVTGVAGKRHHEAFHRFFSRGSWSPDELGRLLFLGLLRLLPKDGPLDVVLDDTLAPKKGPHVFGLGTHKDAVRSTKKHTVFAFGHCWVVLAVLVPVPFSRRLWALPVLLRLYRNVKDNQRTGERHRPKTELARELVDVFLSWTSDRQVRLAADAAYCNDTITRGLDARVVLFGAMRPDADLTAAPTAAERKQTGRRRVRGAAMPKPDELARDGRVAWQRTTANLYGNTQTVYYKTMVAQWYRACGVGLLRIVIVRLDSGKIPWRVFFSTDANVSARALLQTYGRRWNIEVCFRELKQHLGFAQSSARKREAVERVAPFVALTYTALVAWAASSASKAVAAAVPVRPWYKHKRGLSFADILRAAQRVLATCDVLDPRREVTDLQKRTPAPPSPSTRDLRAAA
jgi:hypothetical protein